MQEDGVWRTINGHRVFIKNKQVNNYMNDKIRKSNNNEVKKTKSNNNKYKDELLKEGIRLDDERIADIDAELMDSNFAQMSYLMNKYPYIKDRYLSNPENVAFLDSRLNVEGFTNDEFIARETKFGKEVDLDKIPIAETNSSYFGINIDKYKDYNTLVEYERKAQLRGWHMPINDENVDKYIITHEFGHMMENYWWNRVSQISNEEYLNFSNRIANNIINKISAKTGLSYDEVLEKYFSGYVKYSYELKDGMGDNELFAELFAQMELGKENEATKVLKDMLKDFERRF